MANKRRKKGRPKGPAKPQKKFTVGSPKDFAEHQKRVDATKKRKRRAKGTPGGGRFDKGRTLTQAEIDRFRRSGEVQEMQRKISEGDIASVWAKQTRGDDQLGYKAGGGRVGAGRGKAGASRGEVRSRAQANLDDARRSNRRSLERSTASHRTKEQTGQFPLPEDLGDPTLNISSMDLKAAAKQRREATWRTQGGVYAQPGATRRARTGRSDKNIPASQFIKEELAPSHQRWLAKALNDPQSPFNAGIRSGTARLRVNKDAPGGAAVQGRFSPAQRHRLEVYTTALQQGKSHNEALQLLTTERRGRRPSTKTGPREVSVGADPDALKKSLKRNKRQGRTDKYESLSPKAGESSFGITAQHVNTIDDLTEQFPNLTDRQIVQLQQGQRQTIFDQMNENTKWAQETRANNVSGAKIGEKRDPNRVVFFTTSIGHPSVSVPSDSLVGQYIIRRRKNMLRKEKVATPTQLAGNFPDIVRDMHVVEASTGVALGAEGNIGAFKRNGWRIGTKKSSGFGKPVPVGSQILYDSQGRPMYDSKGNIRYTEGATRRFELGTDKDLGFRVFIG